MMIIALFYNTGKEAAAKAASSIVLSLKNKGITVISDDNEASLIGAEPISSIQHQKVDFILSLGGDGTILRLLHRHPNLDAPILAVNLGSLGFMADIRADEVEKSLDCLLSGNYTVQSRLVIEGTTKDGKSNFAVNEIVIHRYNNPCIIDLSINVNNKYLNTFAADGIIISTPSGSTAYSLAAGGPILAPDLDAVVITPINPHTISNRPIVLTPNEQIRVEYISDHAPVEVTYDGIPCYTIATGDTLSIKRSKRLFRLVCMPEHDYFATLRGKLGWTGKLRGK
jgi:NAD+ kinase